jgi:N-acyl-D-amino-acid deacylase
MSDQQPARYDHVFRNALLFDGSGAPPLRGELAVTGERIAALGPAGTIPPGGGLAEHDLGGKALAPGFIDAHTHDDRLMLSAPDMAPKVSQGVTTVVAGNCGVSLAPAPRGMPRPVPMNLLGGRSAYEFPSFADYARAVAETTPGVNVAALVGHSDRGSATLLAAVRRRERPLRCGWPTAAGGSAVERQHCSLMLPRCPLNPRSPR